MCRSSLQKDEVFINQNASGGSNTTPESHLLNISVVMFVICAIISVAGLYGLYILYKKCHQTWIRNEVFTQNLRRSFRRVASRSIEEPARVSCTCRPQNENWRKKKQLQKTKRKRDILIWSMNNIQVPASHGRMKKQLKKINKY